MKKILLVISFIFFATTASAEPIKLILHHFFVPNDVPQKQMLEPWAREVERLSNNQVEITIVPKMGRGGKPKDLIEQAKKGKIADIIWTVNTYSGKLFPSSEVFELPFIHRNDPAATNLAIREMFRSDLKKEYDAQNLEVMFLHVHQGHAFLTNRYELRTPDNVVKSKNYGRIHSWIAEELNSSVNNCSIITDSSTKVRYCIDYSKHYQHEHAIISSMTEGQTEQDSQMLFFL